MKTIKAPEYSLLPEHLRAGAVRYVEQGIRPGDFLCAVIRNDLTQAILRADLASSMWLREIVTFFEFHTPPACHGSDAALEAWLAKFRAKEES
jgi:hypothetical protein